MPRVANIAARSAIPWEFRQVSPELLVYTWRSVTHAPPAAQFVATIYREDGAWSWRVVADGLPQPMNLGAGDADSFSECAELAAETVGKSFPSPVGHGGLATPASHRYTLAGGEQVDLGHLGGRDVVVQTTGGQELRGALGVGGWTLEVTEATDTVSVHPATVTEVYPAATTWGA